MTTPPNPRRHWLAALFACCLLLGALPAFATPAAQAPASAEQTAAPPLGLLIDQLGVKELRDAARTELVDLGPVATPALLARREDLNWSIRWNIATIAGMTKDPAFIPGMAQNVLHDEEAHVRWRSTWALLRHPRELLAPVADTYLESLGAAGTQEDSTVAWNAAIGLSTLDRSEGLPLIHAGLRAKDNFQRWEAINALGRVHDESSASLLTGVLKTGRKKDRNEAVMSLGKLCGTEAVRALIQALGDSSEQVRLRAAAKLAGCGDASAAGPLRRLLESESDEGVRKQALRALDRLGDSQ